MIDPQILYHLPEIRPSSQLFGTFARLHRHQDQDLARVALVCALLRYVFLLSLLHSLLLLACFTVHRKLPSRFERRMLVL